MGSFFKAFIAVAVVGALLAGTQPGSASTAGPSRTARPSSTSGSVATPRWLLHVQRYSGGISNGVRAYVTQAVQQARAQYAGQISNRAPSVNLPLTNVQMNSDSNPPMPQDETSVAYDTTNPSVAVAAANDYVDGGLWIGHTSDGGQTWTSYFQSPEVPRTINKCTGSDPSVIYSARDQAFYVATLCFMWTDPTSEIQLWKSVDGGATWTPPRFASVPVSNVLTWTGKTNPAVFYDKVMLAVDNNPSSTYYGRIYVTFTKFHMLVSGFSDYCPIEVSYTDNVPTSDPHSATWSGPFNVVANHPGGNGLGASGDQFSMPVVDAQGGLNVAYVLEGCNVSANTGIRFKRSTDGGASWPATPVAVNKPGQWADTPLNNGRLPDKHARGGQIESMAYNPSTGSLDLVTQNYANGATTGSDITFQRSTDHGATWSNAQPISITGGGQPAPNDQFQPWISAAPNGDLYAIWFDNRNDPNNRLIETFQGFSSDDGATWTNTNLSTSSWNPNRSFFSSGSFIGDYNAIAASNTAVYAAWTDGRNTPGKPMGETDIFTQPQP